MDRISELKASCAAAAQKVLDAREAIDAELSALKPLPQRPRSPDPEPEPDLSPLALRYTTLMKLAELMRGRGEQAYRREAAQALELLVEEIKTFVTAVRYEIDVHAELGRRLKELKDQKPNSIKWVTFLRDKGIELSRQRADEYIRIFEGRANVVELREKKRDSMRKTRAKRSPPRGGEPTVDSAAEIGAPDVHALMSEVLEFLCKFEPRALAWKRLDRHTAEDEAQLISAIHQVAEGLILIAQQIQQGGTNG
jgi:hypothetical protein